MNRNKQSARIGLYSAEGRETFVKLIAEPDVLVENVKIGALEKMGLSIQRVEQLNPRLVVGFVNGFGRLQSGQGTYAYGVRAHPDAATSTSAGYSASYDATSG